MLWKGVVVEPDEAGVDDSDGERGDPDIGSQVLPEELLPVGPLQLREVSPATQGALRTV